MSQGVTASMVCHGDDGIAENLSMGVDIIKAIIMS